MKFVIIGAGALGSIYAAYLARAGYEVALVARGDRALRLAKHGVPVTGQESFTARCAIVTNPETLSDVDVVIVAVKTYDTTSALASVRGLTPKLAFSVQNGVLKNQQLAAAFGGNVVLGSIAMFGGDVLPAQGDRPGEVRYNVVGPTVLGELSGGESSRARELVGVFERAGLQAQASAAIGSAEWSKFVAWSGFSTVAILTRLPTWQFMSDPDTALIAARVMRETAAVAMRHGIALQDSGFTSQAFINGSEAEAVKAAQAHGERMKQNAPTFRQSILQDADRNRRLEVNETLGYTLQLGSRLGVPTPTLDLCCCVLRAVSRAAAIDV
jgi:2-dehydropantoate 2-reductase